jgi:hypothetical protein
MRRFHTLLSAVVLLAMLSPAQSTAQESKAALPNDVSLELLGRCLVYSFSYQRTITPSFGIQLGGSVLGGSGASVGFLTAGVRLYLLPKNASPCIAGGLVAITASTGSGPFSTDNSASYGYIGPGFEFRSDGGFLFRGTVYFLVRDGFFVWPGIEIGIAF